MSLPESTIRILDLLNSPPKAVIPREYKTDNDTELVVTTVNNAMPQLWRAQRAFGVFTIHYLGDPEKVATITGDVDDQAIVLRTLEPNNKAQVWEILPGQKLGSWMIKSRAYPSKVWTLDSNLTNVNESTMLGVLNQSWKLYTTLGASGALSTD